MKWNDYSCSEKHICCNCIFWNLFLEGWWVGDLCILFEILWSQVYPRDILRNLQFLNR